MRPLIAVTMSPGAGSRERAQVNASYVRAVEAAGGVPVLVAPQLSGPSLEVLSGAVRGLVLTGGGDVDPARYGEHPHPAVVGVSIERDRSEETLLRQALERNLPILAICRGAELLNVVLGGRLVQDVPEMVAAAVEHAGPEVRHEVRIEPGSVLASVMGVEMATVNSRHHQALGDLGEGLVAVAWSADDLIEAVELPGRWVIGVQWHPEDLAGDSEEARRLFTGLVGAASSR